MPVGSSGISKLKHINTEKITPCPYIVIDGLPFEMILQMRLPQGVKTESACFSDPFSANQVIKK